MLIIVNLIRCFCCLMLLSGCVHEAKADDLKDSRLTVLSTTPMIDDVVKCIGQEQISNQLLIQGNIDPHSYELVKGDNEKFFSSDIVFANGLHLEHGASLNRQLHSHSCTVFLGDLLFEKMPNEFIVLNKEVDPHFWMDIRLFAEVIPFIVDAIGKKDPKHRDLYEQRGNDLMEKMFRTDTLIKEKMAQIPENKRYLVSSHDAFFYFARRYLEAPRNKHSSIEEEPRFLAPEGFAPEGQISLVEIEKVVAFIDKHNISVIFPEMNVNRAILNKIIKIAKNRGKNVKLSRSSLYGDTMGDGVNRALSYLDMMEKNGTVIFEELNMEQVD